MTAAAIEDTATVFSIWRGRLGRLLGFYEARRGRLGRFVTLLFAFFVGLNVLCYWLGIGTAYPERAFGADWLRYLLIQFPVGALGALFDSFSFFITVWIVRRALRTTNQASYIAHLSVDLVIALLATGWVLIVFAVSGWLADLVVAAEPAPVPAIEAPAPAGPAPPVAAKAPAAGMSGEEILSQRGGVYRQRLIDAIRDPFDTDNLRNIYFGIIMGASAMLPTLTHLYLSLASIGAFLRRRYRGPPPPEGAGLG